MRSWRVFAMVGLAVVAAVVAVALLASRPGLPAAQHTQTVQVDGLQVSLSIDQLALGPRTIELAARDAQGQPVALSAALLRFSMAEMDMGTIEASGQPVGQGRLRSSGTFFTMVGTWLVDATLQREGQPPLQASFSLPIAAPGEAAGPLNPLPAGPETIAQGRLLYAEHCASCHGEGGRGDGPAGLGLSPRPADFATHMQSGKHTDGQVFLWIKDGVPNTAMAAWRDRLSDTQIWQLVSYLRTFGPAEQLAQATAPAGLPPEGEPSAPAILVPDSSEPMPPVVLSRQNQLWAGAPDGTLAQLTHFGTDQYVRELAVAPDGQQVAFVVMMQPPVTATVSLPSGALYLVNRDGSNLRAVWAPEQTLLNAPTWSADGQSIYLASNSLQPVEGGAQIEQRLSVVRYDLASGSHTDVLVGGVDPRLSPDGSQLAYLQSSPDGATIALMLAGSDGSGPRTLIEGGLFPGLYAPRFSPDGSRLIVAAMGGPPTDAQGQPLASAPLDWLTGLFAPPTAEAHGDPWELWEINTDGSGLRRLTSFAEDMPTASFSPDGSQIAVAGANGIYLLNSDGSNLRRIDPHGEHGASIDWR